jgi:hypothetical protein
MEPVRTSETLVNFYHSTRCYNQEDSHLQTHSRKNLESYFSNGYFPVSFTTKILCAFIYLPTSKLYSVRCIPLCCTALTAPYNLQNYEVPRWLISYCPFYIIFFKSKNFLTAFFRKFEITVLSCYLVFYVLTLSTLKISRALSYKINLSYEIHLIWQRWKSVKYNPR